MQESIGLGEERLEQGLLATGTEGPTLREIVAQRVAAHRGRRAGAQAIETEREAAVQREREEMERQSRRGSAVVRDAVRARYEKSQSYREFLAAEAKRALEQAQAEAEVAARKAKAVAEAQMQLLAEMEQWREPEPGPREQAIAEYRSEVREELARELADLAMGAQELMAEPPLTIFEEPRRESAEASGDLFAEESVAKAEVAAGGLRVRLYEELEVARPERVRADVGGVGVAGIVDPAETAMELQELEQEIEFRRAPDLGEHSIETVPLPANLIEFPRQLIAPRKARPRLAEGPLREEIVPEPQLRIFEVEPEQISTEPAVEAAAANAPEWQSLLLDSARAVEPVAQPEVQRQLAQPVDIAPVQLRLMAAAVDGCCVGTGFVGFAAVFGYMVGPALLSMSSAMLVGSSAVALVMMALVYQLLFFTFSEATPGMLYARIGLCTFSDENPTRQAMRRRVLAMVLAACPVGLGLLWVWMDDDRLGWHDRISRMYQRAY